MIEVIDLKKSFGKNEVLKGITTQFVQGKTNLIIGQSGSGKTVFMKCLLDLLKPTSGEILFDGKNLSQMAHKQQEEVRSKIGTVFQYSALFDSLDVLQNVTFPLEMFTDMSKSERDDRAEHVLNRVNLSDAYKKYPSELSGGMQKRVAIARAIVNNPDYLFCDEPNSGLDPQTSLVIDSLIHEITIEYNTITVINTHDMNSVMGIGENIVYLKDGLVAWQGSSDNIIYAENEALINFVFSSPILKEFRQDLLEKNANQNNLPNS